MKLDSIVQLKPSDSALDHPLTQLWGRNDVSDIQSKVKALQAVIETLETKSSEMENRKHIDVATVTGIILSTGVALCASGVLFPLILGLSGSTLLGSAIAAYAEVEKATKMIEQSTRYAIALKSDDLVNWAVLWHVCDDEIFKSALYEAATGQIIDNRALLKPGKQSPMYAAIKFASAYCVQTVDDFMVTLGEVKKGVAVQMPKPAIATIAPPPQSIHTAPTTLQLPLSDTWIKGFLASTCLVWGNQGSGKSWFVRYLAKKKADAGYKVIVFDPNSNKASWRGVELYNNYEAIQEKMKWYVEELDARYREYCDSEIDEDEWRSQLWKDGKAYTVICEEMSTYADFIDDKELLSKFVKVAATLSRKQEMPAVFVAHNNTQTCLGDIKGLANLIKKMQQIQLLATTDLVTYQPVASGEALIKLDGSEEWVRVSTPKIESKIVNFGNSEVRDREVKPSSDRDTLERLFSLPSVQEIKPLPNHPLTATIIEIMTNAQSDVVKFDAIRMSRKWGDDKPKSDQLKEALKLLVQSEKIDGSEGDGYRLLKH